MRLFGTWRALLRSAVTAVAETNFLSSLVTMDYVHNALPFVEGATTTTPDLQTMDYAYQAMPFVRYKKA